jgi:hypothetical protein
MTRTAPSRATLRELIATASRAPSVHNTQPWHWCLTGEGVSLFADTSRQLTYADPDGRDLVISCGAALHHLQVAAAAAGWAARVRRMPNPYNDNQLANVSFSPSPATVSDIAALSALVARRTDRRRPASWPVPRERLDELLALNYRLAVTVVAVVSPHARAALLQLLAEADDAQRSSREYVDEVVSWTGRTGPEGIPPSSLVRRMTSRDSHLAASRFPSGTLRDHDLPTEAISPALLAVCTTSDDTGSRLRAGEALSAILLKGTAEGLTMVPLSQAVEVDRTRRLLQDELLGDAAYPQIVLQVGLAPPTSVVIPPTPRRPVSEVISDVASLPTRIGPYHA